MDALTKWLLRLGRCAVGLLFLVLFLGLFIDGLAYGGGLVSAGVEGTLACVEIAALALAALALTAWGFAPSCRTMRRLRQP